MTEYERQKVRDFVNGMTDEEKEIAVEILEKWKSNKILKQYTKEKDFLIKLKQMGVSHGGE